MFSLFTCSAMLMLWQPSASIISACRDTSGKTRRSQPPRHCAPAPCEQLLWDLDNPRPSISSLFHHSFSIQQFSKACRQLQKTWFWLGSRSRWCIFDLPLFTKAAIGSSASRCGYDTKQRTITFDIESIEDYMIIGCSWMVVLAGSLLCWVAARAMTCCECPQYNKKLPI